MLQWTFQLSKNLRILQLRRQCVPWNWLLMTTLKELMFVNCYKYAFVCKECCIFQTCNSHLDQNVLQSHSFFMYNKRNQDSSAPRHFGTSWKDSSAPRHFGTRWKRQFGTKTVRHQDISAPRKFGIRTNRHSIFFQTNVITFFKIKSTEVKKNPSMIV